MLTESDIPVSVLLNLLDLLLKRYKMHGKTSILSLLATSLIFLNSFNKILNLLKKMDLCLFVLLLYIPVNS